MENIKKAAQLIARGMWKRKPESKLIDPYRVEGMRFEDVWSRRNRDVERSQDRETDWVSFMIKLLRAYGECLGARRR